MESIANAIRVKLEKVCGSLEEKYPGVTEDILAKFFEGVTLKAKKAAKEPVVVVKEVVEPVVEPVVVVEPVIPDNNSEKSTKSRSRTVSKKMKEAFIVLAESEEKLAACTKAYKVASDEDIQSKGGDFEGFARAFLSIEVVVKPVAEKKTKAKKEKAPSRIAKWTPTLTRSLTDIVNGSGGVMDKAISTEFHAFVDAMTEEEFASAELAGHMRKFVQSKYPVVQGSAVVAAPLLNEEEDEEDMEEFVYKGETLSVGVTTGKIYRSTPSGDIWIGNAGVGAYSDVSKPSA